MYYQATKKANDTVIFIFVLHFQYQPRYLLLSFLTNRRKLKCAILKCSITHLQSQSIMHS